MYYRSSREWLEDREDMRPVKCGLFTYWVPKQVQAWDKRATRKTPYKQSAKPRELAWNTYHLFLTRGIIK